MLRALSASLLALLLLPAAAQAGGSVAVDGQRLVFTGTPDRDAVYFDRWPGTNELLVDQRGLGDEGTGPSEVGPGCRKGERFGGVTEKIFCSEDVTEIVVDAGDGNDRVTLIQRGSPVDARIDMGGGDDEIDDIAGGATIQLGDGDDTVWAGKAPTTIFGGAGDDDLLCREANAANRAKGARVLDGGPGKDRLCGGLKDDRLIGGAGDDKLYAGEGDDALDGGAGDDILRGDDEEDRIDGGRGEDEIEGGSGKDTITARDRQQDDVSCGAKRDTVRADRVDDLLRCEIVRLR